MIYFYCTSWQFFQMIVKWRISPTTEQIMFTFSILLFHFYSHIPCGMWRIPKLKHFVLLRFLLTHPVWDVTKDAEHFSTYSKISTHTSRVGCDRNLCFSLNAIDGISTHTSRVGCDPRSGRNSPHRIHFYSHIPCGMWPLYIVYFNHIIPIYYRMDL